MDQMLLTGFVSCRFSSLADGSVLGDSAARIHGTTERIPNVRTVTPTTSGDCLIFSPLSSWFGINENSSQQAAALVYSVILLPISQCSRAHRTKTTELLNFNLVGSGGLQCGIQRLPLYQLLAGLATGLTLLACYTPAGAGTLASRY